VEWFAFFYFSYFFLLATHVIPMVLLDRKSKRLAHFCLGMFMVYAVGHIGYMLVPGFGPYHHLAGQFEHPIEGGLFWKLVVATVEGAGAQKDIFPSLHTAAPTFFAIFSFMHRRTNPFRYTWPVMTFFASQIILATMFLRWHWLIDVVVGFSVAATAAFVSRRIIGWEWKRRARLGLPQVFEALSWPASRTAENAENIEEKPTA
jgi:membrane-associated phospholipid phosphatase